MLLAKILSSFLVASAISLSFGGYLLYVNALVPDILVETTFTAVIILFVLSYFVAKENLLAINISTGLGLIAPFFSLGTPAHVAVLRALGTNSLLTLLGTLQILGFIVFPLAFVALRILFLRRIGGFRRQLPRRIE